LPSPPFGARKPLRAREKPRHTKKKLMHDADDTHHF
jgi:hypothetical protein